ncbi:hypothetical protein WA026_007849 [Henosepilachna vigintioctopunctata]|uniref:UPAR/Ly6 domain-containing protein n=1 Tax=Henosepilachna vigintioctopunctata TaxID=420089 RepID=A0AAW1U473_9CUCU
MMVDFSLTDLSSSMKLPGMKYVSITFIVFLSFEIYVSSLNCLSCNNENACLNSPSKACCPKGKVCFSSVVQNLPPSYGEVEYYRGCSNENNVCKSILDYNFGRCYQCDTDNCNNHTLSYSWSEIASTVN